MAREREGGNVIVQGNAPSWSGRALGGVMVLAMLCGCQGRRVLMNKQNLDRGLVIVLPGIDGRAPYNEQACKALCQQPHDLAVELYDWTLPFGLVLNQCSILTNRLAAEGLATRIADYHEKYPGRPVYLVGHSGGTAIAVWAVEALPEQEYVDRIVLLASSLSPGYDLSPALRRTRGGIVNFYSYRDAALLGAGTILVGTMDGQHTEAAGKVGFRPPRRRAAAYNGLIQIPWDSRMVVTGHDGGHFGCTTPRFMRAHVKPWLMESPWGGLARWETPAEDESELQSATLALDRAN